MRSAFLDKSFNYGPAGQVGKCGRGAAFGNFVSSSRDGGFKWFIIKTGLEAGWKSLKLPRKLGARPESFTRQAPPGDLKVV